MQERILTRLSETHGNLCVVGDEDQSPCIVSAGPRWATSWGFPDGSTTAGWWSSPSTTAAIPTLWGPMTGGWGRRTGPILIPPGAPFRHAKTIVAPRPAGVRRLPGGDRRGGPGLRRRGPAAGRAAAVPEKPRGDLGAITRWRCCLHSVQDEVAGPYLDALDDAGIPARCVPAGSGRGQRGQSGSRGAVTITTIHQSKGREWPVVIVGLSRFPPAQRGPGGPVVGGVFSPA